MNLDLVLCSWSIWGWAVTIHLFSSCGYAAYSIVWAVELHSLELSDNYIFHFPFCCSGWERGTDLLVSVTFSTPIPPLLQKMSTLFLIHLAFCGIASCITLKAMALYTLKSGKAVFNLYFQSHKRSCFNIFSNVFLKFIFTSVHSLHTPNTSTAYSLILKITSYFFRFHLYF